MSAIYDVIAPIIREAGKIILSAHEVCEGTDEVSEKFGVGNFVTVYDVKVQEYIIANLLKAFPNAKFIAEEKDNDPAVLQSEYCFVIDPIDGTSNFIHDYKMSCISIALVSRGETVFGAVYHPYLDELFYAQKGEGAYLNGKRIRVSERSMNIAIAAFGTAPYYRDTLGDKTFSLLREIFYKVADVRRCGSAALDLAYLAAGRNDLFFEVILSPWDIAAGEILIREAGGIITDMSGAPLSLSAPTSVIAANDVIYSELIKITRKY